MANTIKIKNSGTASAVPSSLEYGELGLNYADGKIYFKNSSNVIVDYGTIIGGATGASVTVSDTAPEGAGVGDIWYESDTGKMFVYYDSFWVEASGSDGIGVTGATGATGTVDLASPAFTGTPTAPTAAVGTNTTQLATTAFVTTAAANVTSGFRNKIINGDMRIAQRGTATITGSGSAQYPVDRWAVFNGTGTVTFVQSTDAPAGFNASLNATVTATGSYSTSGYTQITHKIEGFNCQDLAYGTASAKTIVLSFWVKSSVVGTQNVSFKNNGNNRVYVATYTIDTANTWEKKIVTVAGDTTGTWLVDSGIGLEVTFNLGMGTTYDVTAGSWQAAAAKYSTSGAIDFAANSGATFYVTGVQLEQNYQPTPFEQRPIGTELALCQRYYYRTGGGVSSDIYLAGYQPASTNIIFTYFHPVTMRATPSLASKVGTWLLINTASQPIIGGASTTSYYAYITVNAGITNANQSGAYTNNSTTYFEFSSEL